MPDKPNDANTAAGSSPAADATGTPSVPSTNANASLDEQLAAYATEQFKDEVEAPVAPSATEDASANNAPAKADAAEGAGSSLSQTEQAQSQPGAQPAKEDYSDVPFHKHARFQELLTKYNESKGALEGAKPQLERLEALNKYCTENRITQKQYAEAVEMQALLNTNPLEARKRLKVIMDALDRYAGEGNVPLAEDLQSEVAAGTLPEKRAREIMALREQRQFTERTSTQTSLESQNQMVMQAMTQWEQKTSAKDPDYGRKLPLASAKFSVMAAEHAMQTGRQFLTPQEAVTLAQKAYDEVNQTLGQFVPRPAATKQLSTNGSATSKPKDESEMDWAELEQKYLAKHLAS